MGNSTVQTHRQMYVYMHSLASRPFCAICLQKFRLLFICGQLIGHQPEKALQMVQWAWNYDKDAKNNK